MRVLGVDLAAQPRNTAAVELRSAEHGGLVADGWLGLGDDALTELGARADVVALDSPLGWPRPFARFVSDMEELRAPAAVDTRQLGLRATDFDVHARTGLWPLAVATDRLGVVAMRAAVLQHRWGEAWGGPASRDGSGRLAEVYPAACRLVWGLRPRGLAHRNEGRSRREDVLRGLWETTSDWLDLGVVAERCREVDHVLDACAAAVGAVAVRLGLTDGPPAELWDRATTEGWVRIPPPLGEIGDALRDSGR